MKSFYKQQREQSSSCKTIGRPRIIEPEGATVDQLTSNFEDLSLSKRTVYRYLGNLWIFTLKGVQLEPVERKNFSEKRTGPRIKDVWLLNNFTHWEEIYSPLA